MKRRQTFSSLLLVLILICTHSSVLAANLRGYSLVQESEYLRLYLNEETAEIAVQDKESEEVWFAGLSDVRQETVKRGAARDAMRGLITLNYYTPSRESRSLNSYVDSVLNEEFTITEIDQGVRFDFLLGKQWNDDSYYPVFIAKDKFEALLDQIPDKFDRQIVEEAYTLIGSEKRDTDPYANVFVFGVDLPYLLGNYEVVVLQGKLLDRYVGTNNAPVERTKFYVEVLTDTMVNRRSDYERRANITPADMEFIKQGQVYALLDGTYPAYYKPELARIFKDAGYTPSDVIADHMAASIDPPKPNPQVFRVPVEVKLDGKDLIISVLAGEIQYPIDVELSSGELATYMPSSVDVAPLFGAAGRSSEGYIFVPDRSGGLIYLNNAKKLNLPSYFGAVYGPDRSVAPQQENISPGPLIRLPVFGIKEGERAWFAIVEEGQALANISAEGAGKTDSFNKAHARFTLTPRTTITLYGVESTLDNRMVDAFAVEPYKGNVTVRYQFLTGDEANYSGMANNYRQYLQDRMGLEKIDPESPVPLAVELIGGFHDQEPVFGAPREIIRPMTTYSQAAEIARDLQSRGINSLRLRYMGWSRGGIEHYFPDNIKTERALGKPEELKSLLTMDDDVEVYLDVNFMTVMRDTMFDNFRAGRDSARFLNRSAAKVFKFDQATFQQIPDQYAYILSPSQLGRVVDGFLGDLKDYPGANISLRRMGSVVYSDFQDKVERAVDRQRALGAVKEQLDRFSEENITLMVEGGNDSAFPYARHIVEAPTDVSRMLIVDEAVPFYQMVLHGLVDFSGQPYNNEGITREKVLKTLETGEIPYFRWSYNDSSVVKGSEFAYLLSTGYTDTVDAAMELVAEVKPILEAVRGQAIVEHVKILDGVYRTTYENGIEVLVNYSDIGVFVNGVYVEGHGYSVNERRAQQ